MNCHVIADGPNALAGFKAPPVKKTETISPMKSAMPIPIGATGVALCFSPASMITVKTNSAVPKASIKRPWTIEVPGVRDVATSNLSGNRMLTR